MEKIWAERSIIMALSVFNVIAWYFFLPIAWAIVGISVSGVIMGLTLSRLFVRLEGKRVTMSATPEQQEE